MKPRGVVSLESTHISYMYKLKPIIMIVYLRVKFCCNCSQRIFPSSDKGPLPPVGKKYSSCLEYMNLVFHLVFAMKNK